MTQADGSLRALLTIEVYADFELPEANVPPLILSARKVSRDARMDARWAVPAEGSSSKDAPG